MTIINQRSTTPERLKPVMVWLRSGDPQELVAPSTLGGWLLVAMSWW
jgi:hypothetical protein